jgi:hypothetical protein
MKRFFIAYAIVAVAVFGCAKDKSPNELPAESWAEADYTKAGVPAADHSWTNAELKTTVDVLGKESAGHRDRLPHRGGAKSGAVFERIVEAPSPAGDPSATYIAHAERFDVLNQISKLYVVSEMASANVEYYAITGRLIREAQVLDQGAEAFLATFAADDPSRPAREAGFAKMRSGWSTMLLGGLMMVSDVRAPEPARISLSQDLTAVLPAMYPRAEPGTKQMIKEQLDKMHDLFKSGALKDALPARL